MQYRNANKRRTNAALIKEENWILLKKKESEKRKLTSIANGSFQVTKINTNVVTLRFPPKSRAYSMINISRIQLYFEPRSKLITTSPDDDTSHEYEIDRIMGYRKRNKKEYYYIHWKRYSTNDDTWESKANISEVALKIWKHQSREKWRKDESAESRLWIINESMNKSRAYGWMIYKHESFYKSSRKRNNRG